jgi:hypothetical protein
LEGKGVGLASRRLDECSQGLQNTGLVGRSGATPHEHQTTRDALWRLAKAATEGVSLSEVIKVHERMIESELQENHP